MRKALLSLLLLAAINSFATTYYVRTDGNNGNTGTANSSGGAWLTLAYASTHATTAGDTIRLVSGTYTVSVTIDLSPGVSLVGDGYGNTTVNATMTGTWSTMLQLQSADNTNGNQVIQGIKFMGGYVSESNYKAWIGIWIVGRSNVEIKFCHIEGFKDRGVIYAGINAPGGDPIVDPGNHATGNKFHDNVLINSATNVGSYGAGCINIGVQNGMEIYNNTIVQDQRVNFKNGWPIKYWLNGWLKGCKIYNNTLKKAYYQGTYPGENGDWDFAIELFNIQGLEIYNNEIQGCIDLNYNYKGSYTFSVWIHHNTLNHATANTKFESGIILEFATQSALIENNIINNSSTGVQFNTRGPGNNGGYGYPAPTGGWSALTNNVIRNNLFSNLYQPGFVGTATGIGVFSEGTDDPYIRGLYIYNNTITAKSGSAPWIGLDFTSQPNGSADTVYIRNNIVVGFADSWIKGTAGAGKTNMNHTTITHNNPYNNSNSNAPSWPGGNPSNYTYSNNITTSPSFVSSSDFTLAGGSPCIDAGVNVGIAYNGTAPDMGYSESSGTPANSSPSSNAGSDQSITLPTSSVSLSGSGNDTDGTIAGYLWTVISGPNSPTIVSSTSASTSVTGLIEGTYVFQLRVTDNLGATGNDQVTVIVNSASAPPPGTIRYKRKIKVY